MPRKIMKIEIYSRFLSDENIQVLMDDVNPKETSTHMSYFVNPAESYGCKKVKCTEHHIVKDICSMLPFDTESVSIAYYPTNSYNSPHADNCVIDNGVVKRVKDWTHTAVVFLNNDFTGGNLVYPNQGCVFVPTVGTLIIAPAGEEYIHYVEPVTTGERFTLVFRMIQRN
jgi:predicted 2-oxoglutarate/Fe(II)-dependent dioxygenase YbiX